MKILVIGAAAPFPPIGGGRLRTYHLLRALSAAHDVTLVTFAYEAEQYDDSQEIPFPLRVVPVPWEWPELYQEMCNADEAIADRATAALSDPGGEPWFSSFYEVGEMERELRTLSAQGFDLVLFEGTDMARFLPLVPDSALKVLDLMDVHSQMALRAWRSSLGSERQQLELEVARTLRFERDLAQACDLCLVCSDLEADAASELLEIDRPYVVPNGVDTAWFTPQSPSPDRPLEIVFTGSMDYAPNVEGVGYFVREIFPRICKSRADARFHIVGARPVEEVLSLSRDNIIVHGLVDDIRPFLSMATVVVVPLLSGGGTRLKILEAAASCRAIVSTSLGAEGLSFQPSRDLMIADTPEEFAQCVLRLAGDAAMRGSMAEQARLSSLPYDWTNVVDALHSAIDSLYQRHQCHAQ
jgi:glycosyltransferase involved in cell wall biosynthesis